MNREILDPVKMRKQRRKVFSGILNWKNLSKNKQFRNDDFIVIQPTPYSVDEISSLVLLNDLIKSNNYERILYITSNKTIKYVLPFFTKKAKCIIVSPEIIESIVALYQFFIFDRRICIASISLPFGRMGERIVGVRDITDEEVMALAVYRLFIYCYHEFPNIPESETYAYEYIKWAKKLRKEKYSFDISNPKQQYFPRCLYMVNEE